MLLSWGTLNIVLAAIFFVIALIGAVHALTHKRDPRAALLWFVVCFSIPLLGCLAYAMFGINRSNWKTLRLAADKKTMASLTQTHACPPLVEEGYVQQVSLAGALTGLPLLDGNQINILRNGEQAYPAMLSAIRSAKHWIYLATYIFEHKKIGGEFIQALADAQTRGVEVFVLLDGVGAWYSGARTAHRLRKKNVHVARFLPLSSVIPKLTINLRNHRKLLIADGQIAFTGGMNIRQAHLVETSKSKRATQDLLFQIDGPVIAQLLSVFQDDWHYASGESLKHTAAEVDSQGRIVSRAISDGPGVVIDVLTKILVSAVHHARESITIVTPYFLPPQELVIALQSAAIRGVDVRIILPGKNNLPYVQWAMNNALWQFLHHDVKVYYQTPPFDHAKLLLIDRYYCQFGSANLDTRSLRLNFEMNLECYDRTLGKQLDALISEKILHSKELHLSDLNARSWPKRIWDALWWLFTPYL